MLYFRYVVFSKNIREVSVAEAELVRAEMQKNEETSWGAHWEELCWASSRLGDFYVVTLVDLFLSILVC